MYKELPSIEDARAFLDAINTGREAIGLDRIDTLDYDACDPENPRHCLSATHLFAAANMWVDAAQVRCEGTHAATKRQEACAAALGMERVAPAYFTIPDVILKVTDPFDASEHPDSDEWHALRDRLVEAGVVD